MEIRRIEPELITPATASEHSARIEKERRQGRQSREQHQQARPEHPPDDSRAEQEEHPVSAPVYQQDGHLQEEHAGGDGHIDFIA